MSKPWARRICISLIDSLYGSFLYLPLAVLFLNRSLRGFGTIKWDNSDIPPLDGKVAIVTGGNAGIGYYTVKALALRGAKVYMGARSETRAKAAIERLRKEHPEIKQESLVWLPLDLSNQLAVVNAANEFASKEKRLDILVNNAGVAPYEYTTTSDGFEMTMAVNHVGHWTLTHCLLLLLKSTAARKDSDVRVITVSSSGEANSSANEFTSPKDLDDPCSSIGWENSCLSQGLRYGTSKLANVLFAKELQNRMDEDGTNLISLSLNPGTVGTSGASDVMPFMVRPLVPLLFSHPERGADTTLFAATAPGIKKNSAKWKGAFLDGPGNIKAPSLKAQNAAVACNLWRTTELAVRNTGVLDKVS